MASIAKIVLGLSLSDLPTFILPNTLFGICTALNDSMWEVGSLRSLSGLAWLTSIAMSVLQVVLWNWINLLLFNLSNQRLPDSIAEDRLNKPHRPIASGQLHPVSARRALLYGIPSVVLISYFLLGAWEESVMMVGLNWMYNDLKGGDESFVLRNLIIAISFGVYNHASSRIARGWWHVVTESDSVTRTSLQDPVLSVVGQQWIVLISLIILTTMQVQDLRDVEGDKKRGRQTMMLVLGLQTSRWCTAIPIFAWSLIVPYVLGVSTINLSLLVSIGLGVYTAWRVIYLTTLEEDDRSWKIWALWLVALYTLPLAKGLI